MRQFPLRNLFLFTAIIAAALGWLFRRHPSQAGTEVHVRNGHALTIDAATGRVWRGPIPPDDSTANP